ncbi:hypothetical protein [Streptomyces sp. enrichment culture]|uniref:hypothetical protein n=1 Tax=Streptomyces sp. enrichment culture TaxID=1795815 RepID=UPI003F55F222
MTAVWALLVPAVVLVNDRSLETVRAVFPLLTFVGIRPLALASLFRWRRWTAGMEHGAWFAGDPERGGVLALPGGRALTLVTAG